MFISGSETTPSEGPKVARVGEHSAESAPALATGRDSGRGAGEHKRHRKYVNTLVGVVRTFQHFFTAQERHGAGGAVKKESETSADLSTFFHRAREAWGRRRCEKRK